MIATSLTSTPSISDGRSTGEVVYPSCIVAAPHTCNRCLFSFYFFPTFRLAPPDRPPGLQSTPPTPRPTDTTVRLVLLYSHLTWSAMIQQFIMSTNSLPDTPGALRPETRPPSEPRQASQSEATPTHLLKLPTTPLELGPRQPP